jgi:folylpolyglutamate synthase/dihydrofolate synthase
VSRDGAAPTQPAANASGAPARLEAYARAQRHIDVELVRLEPRRRDPAGKVATALAFNAALGDPQRAQPSVQVAGTSGKGSVCALLAHALEAAGLRAGLHVSPYLQAFTEKTWIDGRYLSPEGLTAAVDEVRPVAERFAADPDGPASVHGMASLATSYVAFRDAGLDVAVMETGVGGRFDLVQGLDRALSVITDLGLDHTKALGPTLEEIAAHKAGILEAGVPAIAVRGPGWEVLAAEAERVGADLRGVVPSDLWAGETRSAGRTRATLRLPTLGEVPVDLPGEAPFLLRNAAVAAAALDRLAEAGWAISANALTEGFRRVPLPGRFEVVQERSPTAPRVILDGAHNGQKLAALLAGLDADPTTGPLSVVLAASGQRAPEDLLAAVAPRAARVHTCQLDLYGKGVVPAPDLAEAARAAGAGAEACESPEAALDAALATTPPAGTVLVTGSLYLVGRLRDRWFPTEQVILQGTSWPVPVEPPAPNAST